MKHPRRRFRFLLTTQPQSPEQGGQNVVKAFSAGDSSTGLRKLSPSTPKAITKVTMELEAMAMVETAPPGCRA